VQDDNETLLSELPSAGYHKLRPSIPSVVSSDVSTGHKPKVSQNRSTNILSLSGRDVVALEWTSHDKNSPRAPSWDRRADMGHIDKALIGKAPLTKKGSSETVILSGTGGLGKTQIALEYAYRQREASRSSVFWMSAEQTTGLNASQVLSSDGPPPHLNIEEQKRMLGTPPVRWNSSSDRHAIIESEDHIAKDLRTMIDAAFQRDLDNLKASSRSNPIDELEPHWNNEMDKLTSGSLDPRTYFLEVVECLTSTVAADWKGICAQLVEETTTLDSGDAIDNVKSRIQNILSFDSFHDSWISVLTLNWWSVYDLSTAGKWPLEVMHENGRVSDLRKARRNWKTNISDPGELVLSRQFLGLGESIGPAIGGTLRNRNIHISGHWEPWGQPHQDGHPSRELFNQASRTGDDQRQVLASGAMPDLYHVLDLNLESLTVNWASSTSALCIRNFKNGHLLVDSEFSETGRKWLRHSSGYWDIVVTKACTGKPS